MSSTNETKAVVHRGAYNEESRKHPGLAFMEVINTNFDARDHSVVEDLYTEDFSSRGSHGDEHSHDEPGFHDDHTYHKHASKYYTDPLSDHEHFAEEIIALDDKNGGYDIYWMGDLYAHVKGKPEDADHPVKDPKGKAWDVVVPVSYHFYFVKDSSAQHGYRMASMKAWKDTTKINELLEERDHGHLKTHKNKK